MPIYIYEFMYMSNFSHLSFHYYILLIKYLKLKSIFKKKKSSE